MLVTIGLRENMRGPKSGQGQWADLDTLSHTRRVAAVQVLHKRLECRLDTVPYRVHGVFLPVPAKNLIWLISQDIVIFAV